MTSAIKSFLVLLLTLPLLIYIGSEIGSDEYLLPGLVGGLVFAVLIYGMFFRGRRVECIILMLLVGGYTVGNRGFAQLYIVQPLFIGEVGMLLIFGVLLFRFAISREFILPRHRLTWLIGLYLALAFARLCWDYRTYGIDAVRDSAIAYYAVFFFVAYQIGRREDNLEFVDRSFVWAFVLLAVVAIISTTNPQWLEVITIRGLSPLAQKQDITATFCCLGILFLAIRLDLMRSNWARLVLFALLIVSMMLTRSRAAIVALLGALVLTWVAGRRGFIVLPLALGLLGISGIFVFGADSSGQLGAARDQLLSIVDVTGTYQYQTAVGDEKQADNEFRRALWDSIFKQTNEDSAWLLGKGFGYDFISTFESVYQRGSWENLRSAHNYYVTVYGRMGLLGVGLFIAISFEVIRHGLRSALALRRGDRHDPQALAYWCAVWTIMITGTFGVVLEGPMGAIPFWTIMGFALASNDRFELERQAESSESTGEVLLPRLAQSPSPQPVGVR